MGFAQAKIANALRRTEERGGGRLILYDDFGRLTLAPASSLNLNLLLTESNAEGFTDTITIDKNTYNQIRVFSDTIRGGRNVTTLSDKTNIERWGTLQRVQRIPESENPHALASSLLALHNQEQRSLSLTGVIGDLRVRAGASLLCHPSVTGNSLNSNSSSNLNTRFIIEKAKHYWRRGRHYMNLVMSGGEVVGGDGGGSERELIGEEML